ncbi:hypothetical protein [Neobacillus sp. PS3-40]|jgi:primosomal protein N'|uniref:hypothetical protein n=1 Tax=Neobacillus sp. PS3-40 TaxID=3070679 RepID=UPI0027E2099A|nr:hypothetical protein [Neobacillus sp. PS3-40]WML43273.1 hypothetical protein RCG20_15945 [Neobacillus sp. PS3-40]
MSICPICNGFRTIYLTCETCGSEMLERGRIMDYYDDYSPYMDIDLMKMEDGYKDTYSNHKCPHLFRCPNCASEEVILIKE